MQAIGGRFEWDLTPYPRRRKSDPAFAIVQTNANWVFAKAKHPEAGYEFVEGCAARGQSCGQPAGRRWVGMLQANLEEGLTAQKDSMIQARSTMWRTTLPSSRRGVFRAVALGTGALGGACGGEAAPAAPVASSGEVEAWTRHTGERGQWFEGQLVPAFNAAYPAVRVKHVAIASTDEFYEKLTAAVVSGSPPGLAQLKDFWTPDLAVRQVLAPLDAYVTRSKVVRPELYLKIQWDACKWDGKLYSIPIYAGATNLFANVAAAREVGLVDAKGQYKPADTWEEFAEQTVRLNAPDRPRWGTQLYRYDANESTLWAWLPYLYQNGGEFTTKDFKKPLFHRPEGVEALQYQVNMVRSGTVRPAAAPVRSPVENGAIGIWVTGSGGAEGYKRAQTLEFDVAPLPRKKNRASSLVGNTYALARGAPNVGGAWALLEFLQRDEHDAAFNSTTGNLPAKLANLARPPWSTEKYQQVQIQMAQLPETRFRVMFPGYTEVGLRVGQALADAYALKLPPKDALEEAARDVERLLAAAPPTPAKR
jgi:ABC-type glycerol-3-phosphate transport system substrate-binding protein